MTGTLWLTQAAQSGGVAGQTSGDAVERSLADLTSALEAVGLSLILVAPCVSTFYWGSAFTRRHATVVGVASVVAAACAKCCSASR